MTKQTTLLWFALGLFLSVSCQPGLWAPLQPPHSLIGNDPAMAPEVYFKKTKISPKYEGPLSIAIDPATRPEKSGGIGHPTGGFRITAQQERDPAPGENQRRMAWTFEHPTGGHHGRDDLSRYFDPNNLAAFPGLQIDPAMGEVDTGGGYSAGFVSINGSEPIKFTSKILTVFPKSEAALQEILSLVSGRVIGRQIEDYVNIELDLGKADLSKLPTFMRLRSQYLFDPITSASFSSLNMARTVTQLLQLLAREDLLYSVCMEGYSESDISWKTDDPLWPNKAPNSTDFARHFPVHQLGEAWEYGLGTKVKVAVIDQNGFSNQSLHHELKRATSEAEAVRFEDSKSYDYPKRDRLFNEIKWVAPGAFDARAYHGTTVSLAGFADINNLVNGVGVAPNVSLVPIKVSERTIDKSNAIRYAVRVANADLIVASFHTPKIPDVQDCFILNEGEDLRHAIALASSLGSPYIASAGNQSEDTWKNIEGGCTAEALLVGGVDQKPTGLQRWYEKPGMGSNYSDRVDIWADARVHMDDLDDVGTTPSGDIHWGDGTSVSAPIVGGTVAIMKGIEKKLGRRFLSVPLIKQILWDTGTKYNSSVNGQSYRISVLNAEAAVRETFRKYFYSPVNPDDFRRQEYFGIMVNARPDSRGKSEIADLIQNGTYRTGVLQATVAAGAYSRHIAQSPVAGYAYVRVHGWPDGEAYEVFKVDSLPWPKPVLTGISQSRFRLGADEAVTVTGQFLASPKLRLYDQSGRLVGSSLQAKSTNVTLTSAAFSLASGLDPGTYTVRAVTVSGESNPMSIILESGDTPTITLLKQYRDNREIHIWGSGFASGMTLRLTAAQLPAPVDLPLRVLQKNTANGDYAVFDANFLPVGNYGIKLVSAYGNAGQGYNIAIGVSPTPAPLDTAATMTAYVTMPSQSNTISSFVVQGQNFTPTMTMQIQPQDNSFSASAPVMAGSVQTAVSNGEDRAAVQVLHNVLSAGNYTVGMQNAGGIGNIIPAVMRTVLGGMNPFSLLGLPVISSPPTPSLCPTGYAFSGGRCAPLAPLPSPSATATTEPSSSPSPSASPTPTPPPDTCSGYCPPGSGWVCGLITDPSYSQGTRSGTVPDCGWCPAGKFLNGGTCTF